MRRVAYVTASHGFADPALDPAAHREHALQLKALCAPCEELGLQLVPVPWDRLDPDSASFSAAVIGTAWDYADRPEQFLARLERWSSARPLLNPLATVRWNLEKTYLRDLAERGVAIVPTLWRERADARSLRAAFDELDTDQIVVKPVVGQNSWRQVRLTRGEAPPDAAALPPAQAMIQPYLPSIEDQGELSVLCFEREPSHALRKRPRAGDYRIQASYGGSEEPSEVSAEEREVVDAALAAVTGPLLVGRVDLVRDAAGRSLVMELELIEPYLFPEQGGGAQGVGRRFADALKTALATA